MSKLDVIMFIIVSLVVFALIEMFLIVGFIDLMNDKDAYIRGLQSDRAVCEGKLDTVIQDYAKMESELKEYKRKYGDE